MANLYNLAAEYINLVNTLEESVDPETGEINADISTALETVGDKFTDKAIAVATVARDYEITVKQIDNEITRLEAMREQKAKRQKYLEDYLLSAMESVGVEKIEGISAKIKITRSEQTIVENLDMLPEKYVRIKVKETREPDKKAIKQAIENGEDIVGAYIKPCKKLKIT